jgi:hypothetical protein
MNHNCNEEESICCGARLSYVVAVFGALLVVLGLVWAMKHYTTPASITAQRAAERAKNLVELHAAEKHDMENYGWVDQPKGIVRLTVERAVELTVDGGKDLASARKDLIARVEKATYVPPKAPEKPSAFE